MTKSSALLGAVLLGLLVFAAESPSRAQTTIVVPGEIAAPDYGSGASAGSLSNGNFNTPESDGRPGVYYFDLGVEAIRKGDYGHAIDMYKVAASWAYKPAEYNLALMYFKGQGVAVNRALGAAWMVLAAERGEPQYMKARDLMVTLESKAEFAATDKLWNQLKTMYGDKIALRRAKAQWAWVKTHQTGTRVGGVTGPLYVGANDKPATHNGAGGHAGNASMLRAGWGYLPSGSLDGSVAYRQFQESDEPYSPIFMKHRTGTVQVEPLQQIKPESGKHSTGQQPDHSQPPHSLPPASA